MCDFVNIDVVVGSRGLTRSIAHFADDSVLGRDHLRIDIMGDKDHLACRDCCGRNAGKLERGVYSNLRSPIRCVQLVLVVVEWSTSEIVSKVLSSGHVKVEAGFCKSVEVALLQLESGRTRWSVSRVPFRVGLVDASVVDGEGV